MEVTVGGEPVRPEGPQLPRRAQLDAARRLRAGRRRGRAAPRPGARRATSASAARATPRAPRSARSRRSTTPARRWPRPSASSLEVIAQAVASKICVDPVSGEVSSVEYQRYDDPGLASAHGPHRARAPLRAGRPRRRERQAHAGLRTGRRDGHARPQPDGPPVPVRLGLARVPVGAFRGPLSTAGIDDLRGGAFRPHHAAFRFDIGNDGWRATTGAPDTTVAEAVANRGLFGDGAARAPRSIRCRARSASRWPSSSCPPPPTG